MCWLNSSAGSGFFCDQRQKQLYSAWARHQTLCLPVACHGHSSQDPSHILSHFRLPHLEEGSRKICLHTCKSSSSKRYVPKSSVLLPARLSSQCGTNLFPVGKTKMLKTYKFWILYLVMRRWRFSFCDTEKRSLPFTVTAKWRFPPSLKLNGLLPMFRFELVYEEQYC